MLYFWFLRRGIQVLCVCHELSVRGLLSRKHSKKCQGKTDDEQFAVAPTCRSVAMIAVPKLTLYHYVR